MSASDFFFRRRFVPRIPPPRQPVGGIATPHRGGFDHHLDERAIKSEDFASTVIYKQIVPIKMTMSSYRTDLPPLLKMKNDRF
jgi:hypothetical protein